MPKLPDITAYGNRAVFVDPITKTGWSGTTRTGALEGAAFNEVGNALQKLSKDIEAENLKFDTVMAENAYNKVREAQLDMTNGEKGYLQRRGEDAAGKPIMEEYTKRYDEQVNRIADGLNNDRQKALLRRRADVSGLELKSGILSHVTREREILKDKTAEHTVQVETDIASKNFRDQSAQNTAQARIEQAIINRYDEKGYHSTTDAEGNVKHHPVVEDAIRNSLSKLSRNRVMSYLTHGEDQKAEEVFKADNEKNKYTAEDRLALEHALEVGSTLGFAQRTGDRLMRESQNNIDIALSNMPANITPKQRQALRQELHMLNTENKERVRVQKDTELNSAINILEQNKGDVRAIPAPLRAEIGRSPGLWDSIEAKANRIREGKDIPSDEKALAEFYQLSKDSNAMRQLSDTEYFQRFASKFSNADLRKTDAIMDAYRTQLRKDPEASLKIDDHISFEQRLFDTLESHKLIKPSRNGKTGERELSESDKLYLNDFRREADRAIADWQRANGTKHVPPEKKQEIMDKLATTKFIKANVRGHIWDTSNKAVLQMTPDELSNAYIPIDDISAGTIGKMYNYAMSEGIIPKDMKQSTFADNYRKRIERARFVDMTTGDIGLINRILRGEQ